MFTMKSYGRLPAQNGWVVLSVQGLEIWRACGPNSFQNCATLRQEGQLGHTFSQTVTCCAVLLPMFLRNRPFSVSMEVMNDVNTLLKFTLSLEGMVPHSVTALYPFYKFWSFPLTLIVLMWRIGWAHNNARK